MCIKKDLDLINSHFYFYIFKTLLISLRHFLDNKVVMFSNFSLKIEMIFVQIFLNNFWNNHLSHSHIFYSLYCFCLIRRGEKRLSQKLSKIGCTNIIPQQICIVSKL